MAPVEILRLRITLLLAVAQAEVLRLLIILLLAVAQAEVLRLLIVLHMRRELVRLLQLRLILRLLIIQVATLVVLQVALLVLMLYILIIGKLIPVVRFFLLNGMMYLSLDLHTVKELFKRILTTDQRALRENTTELIKLLVTTLPIVLHSLRVRVQAPAVAPRLPLILLQVVTLLVQPQLRLILRMLLLQVKVLPLRLILHMRPELVIQL